ncbi:MAG: CBS domain-containing protein [Thermoanaerobaculia bacterium]
MTNIAELIEGKPLIHVEPGQSVRAVARMMSDRNVGAVAVLDSGTLVGVFSERDIMTRVVAPGLNPESTPISKVMTRDLVVGNPKDDIDVALQKMHAVGCRHLPVVDEGNLIGMISIRDLLQVDDDTNRARATFLKELVVYSPDYES